MPTGIYKRTKAPWIKGKHHSEATILKIKEARKKQVFSTEARLKMSKNRKGNKNANWKGGKWKNEDGYIFLFSPKHPRASRTYVFEHRLIVEQQIGRYLKPEERVHHRNEIRDDNRPQNLMAFINNSVHKRFEGGQEVKPTEILFDGRKIK